MNTNRVLAASLFAGSLLAVAVPLRAQANPDSVKRENDCRLAAQALSTGNPGPHVAWARTFMPWCGGRRWAHAAVEALDRLRHSSDHVALQTEWSTVQPLRDATLFRFAHELASDRSASTGARIYALLGLVYMLDANSDYTYELFASGPPPANQTKGCRSGRYAGVQATIDGEPLPADAGAQVAALATRITNDQDESQEMRAAAGCVLYAIETMLP